MQNSIATVAATSDPPAGQTPPQRRPESAAPERQTPAEEAVDLRLVIEEDKATGSYIYKTVNRETGEVITQLPRAEILKLRETVTYAAGQVIRAKA